MSRLVDLAGRRFGNLTVISRCENTPNNRSARWLCKCDCGKYTKVRGTHLTEGRVISCGCVGRAKCNEARIKHSSSKTRLYGVWLNMRNRCYNTKVRSYKDYGANGITVCDEWKNDFGKFKQWALAAGYDPEAPYGKCTIDRIDVYGNYCPENCRWVDAKVQANNRRKKVG